MKAIAYAVLLIAGIVIVTNSHAAPSQRTQACINAFVAENTPPNTPVEVRVNEYIGPAPIELRSGMELRLRAVDKSSGRTVAEADCRVTSGEVSIRQLQ